jgi:hypothetical protein
LVLVGVGLTVFVGVFVRVKVGVHVGVEVKVRVGEGVFVNVFVTQGYVTAFCAVVTGVPPVQLAMPLSRMVMHV